MLINLEHKGLLWTAAIFVVPTNGAQLPPILATDGGMKLTILQRNVGHKWLGCMLTAGGSQSQQICLQYYLPETFYANQYVSPGRSVSISNRLKYFNAVVSAVACLRNGDRAIYNSQLATLDVEFRRV